MTTQPKYEDLVLKVAELEWRESSLREELKSLSSIRNQNRVLAETVKEVEFISSSLQQRLTVAEQREGDLKKLLCDVINEAATGFAALKVDLANRVNDALKPAEEGEEK